MILMRGRKGRRKLIIISWFCCRLFFHFHYYLLYYYLLAMASILLLLLILFHDMEIKSCSTIFTSCYCAIIIEIITPIIFNLLFLVFILFKNQQQQILQLANAYSANYFHYYCNLYELYYYY